MANKMTFGFRNVNGAAMNIKLINTPTGSWPSERTILGLRSHIVKELNRHGKRAEALTKTDGWSPRLTGALIRSIKWIEARGSELASDRILKGALSVSVPYGRRQEFEHTSRGRYLGRALDAVFPGFVASLRNRNVLEDIIFSRRQGGGGGVSGGRF